MVNGVVFDEFFFVAEVRVKPVFVFINVAHQLGSDREVLIDVLSVLTEEAYDYECMHEEYRHC